MLFITGDTHGIQDIEKLLSLQSYIDTHPADEPNYLIVLGDFGYGWSKKTTLDMKYIFSYLNYSILFIDGNHENHDYLATLPTRHLFNNTVAEIHGAGIPLYHLLRGRNYTIQDQTFYTLGGAHSHDKQHRTPPHYNGAKAWWSQELPTPEELATFETPNTDFILTHQAPQCYFPIDPVTRQPYRPDIEELNFLSHLNNLEYTTPYLKWFFGHWHIDNIMLSYSEKTGIALYNNVYQIFPDKSGCFIF